MTISYDLAPAAAQLARLANGVDDNQLGAATPCEDWPVAVLLGHLLGLTAASPQQPASTPFQPARRTSTGICRPAGKPSCTSASTPWSSRGVRLRHGKG